MDIRTLSPNLREEMRRTVETHRQNLQAKKNTIKQLNDGKTKLKQQGEDVKRQVQTFIDSLIEVLLKKKQNIIEAVENQTKQSVETLSAETVKIENEIKEIETSLEKAEKLLTRTTDIEVVGMNLTSLQRSFEGSVQNKPDSSDPGSLPTFTFVKNENLMEAVKREEIGSLEISHDTKASQSFAEGKGLKEPLAGVESKFNLITRDYEKTMRYNEKDLVTVEILDEQKRDCKMGLRIQDNKTGQYQISYCPRDQGKYSISIKVNGQHVYGSPYDLLVKAREQAVSSGNVSSRVRNSDGHSPSPIASRSSSPEHEAYSQAIPLQQFQFKPVSFFGGFGSSEGKLSYPWGVTVSNTDEIAVTDQLNHRVQIFDSNGNYLRSFGSCGASQGKFIQPHGICFDNNGNILVADKYNHRIPIFTLEGRYKDMLRGKGSLDSQLTCPWGLSLDANGDIIVPDSSSKLIKIFTTDGQFVRKIGEPGSFSSPVHCVQCDEYFIVSDTGDHSIKVLSRDGKLQHKFGQQGDGDGEFESPRCLTVTRSKHLMVCDRGNNRIQIFELGGRFVGKFGTIGSNLGELRRPTSVAVLSDGRIVVCEWLNHRIQIFE